MPSQLQRRLERLLDPSVARSINALSGVPRTDTPAAPTPAQLLDLTKQPATNTHRHWPDATFGTQLYDLQSVMIHGTSGWPSYASADNFRVTYDSTAEYDQSSNPLPTHWHSNRGIGPQYFVEPNGTIYPLIGPENLEGDAQFTWHSFSMSFLSLGIENGDGGDDSHVVQTATLFRRLDSTAAATGEDLAGMRLYGLLHPGHGAQDLNLIWFAVLSTYSGPGDIGDIAHRYPNWNNTLFTERDYRSLALLCRFLAERNGIPRNFPLLPYASVKKDSADASIFRKLLLADPLADQIGAELTVNMTVARAGGAPFAAAYAPHHAQWWTSFFGLTLANGRSTPCFRGFMSHMINGDHPCPGPLFDWHRVAREVWDWWWYPFDFDPAAISIPRNVLTSVRPYRAARGDTPLVEYYYDATGTAADYDARKDASDPSDRFTLSGNVPIYALANGVAVAARLSLMGGPTDPGFLLTRHEVFHASATTPAARIDYDQPPTYVWTLFTFLYAPGFSVAQIGAANPDWLNRFVIRLKETELAVAYHTAHANDADLTSGWNHQPARPTPPSSIVRRPTTGTTIERTAAAYRPIADDLVAGNPVLFPPADDDAVTPVTILLGDYLGGSGTLPGGGGGVQVEIFSTVKLDVPGAVSRAVSALGERWWNNVSGPTGFEVNATDLPKSGIFWQYSMTNFLKWINDITWASEWPKYGAVDSSNVPLPLPPRPNSRTSL